MWLSFPKIDDIPFSINSIQQHGVKKENEVSFLSWSIGLIMFVSMFCLYVYIQVANAVNHWEANLTDGFCLELSEGLESSLGVDKKAGETYIKHNLGSLHIEEIKKNVEQSSLSELKKILSLLKTKDYIKSSNVIYRNNLTNFLGIFRGKSENDINEELPAIIDIKTNRKLSLNEQNELKLELDAISPGLEIQARRFWQEDLILTAGTIKLILMFLTFISFVIMILITFFTTHIQMVANRKSVEILNLVGASSSYVARQFGGNIFKRIVKCGVTVSILIVALAFWTFDEMFYRGLQLILWCIGITIATALLMSWVAFLGVKRSFYMFDINDNS